MYSTQNVKARRGFVSSLKLKGLVEPLDGTTRLVTLADSNTASAGPPSASDDKKEEAFVSGACLNSFVAKLNGQQKNDVLDSGTLAQFAADAEYDRKTGKSKDVSNWFNRYTDVMTNVGWVIQGFQFQDYKSGKSSFTLSEVTLEILEGLVGGEEMVDVVRNTLKALQNSSGGLTVFSQQSSSAGNAQFLILPCNVDQSGQVTTVFIGFDIQGNVSADDFFFFTYKTEDISLRYATQTCTLNENLYADVRQEVHDKLKGKTKNFIHDLKITKTPKS